jgi:hypothetical protein
MTGNPVYSSRIIVSRNASEYAVCSRSRCHEQVEVRETTTGVDKDRTEGSQVIAPEQIADLPIADRDFIDFVLLTPTATVGRD